MSDPRQSIVVVEDDTGMNQAIERLVNAAGYRAVTFSSAEELLEAGAATNAACLILDVHLPGLSGFQLWRRLEEERVTPPVIFVTAYDDPASQAQARAAGALGYLTKPFAGQNLLKAINGALERT
jgi:FixJ family two-component response regulator